MRTIFIVTQLTIKINSLKGEKMKNFKKTEFFVDNSSVSYEELSKDLETGEGKYVDQFLKMPEDTDPEFPLNNLIPIPNPIRICQGATGGALLFEKEHTPTIIEVTDNSVTVSVVTMDPILSFNCAVSSHLYYAAMMMAVQERNELSRLEPQTIPVMDERIYAQLRNGLLPAQIVGPTTFDVEFPVKTFGELQIYLEALSNQLEIRTAILINQI
jgi:hypothetical protein